MDEQIKPLYKSIRRLQAVSKKSDKTKVLLESDSDSFRNLLKFLLDPTIVTGLSGSKINKPVAHLCSINMQEMTLEEMLFFVKSNNTGSDSVINVIQTYISAQPVEYHDFLKAIFTKNLPIGVEAKTVNQIYGCELIPIWEVQQAHSIDKVKLKKNEWIALSQKLNGNRGTYFDGELVSRQARTFTGLDHILNDLHKILKTGWVVDGEIIRKNTDGLTDGENFRIGTGVLNSDDTDKSCLKYVIFDILPQEEFRSGVSSLTYRERILQLSTLKEVIQMLGLENVEVVTMVYQGTNHSEIQKWLDYAVSKDWEGLVLNRDTPYYCKRHNGILKVKRFYTMDLRVLRVEEGGNRLAGTLGAIVVDFKGNEVNVGSGFDDDTRKQVWSNPEKYIGSLACVKYKEISKDKNTGLESLQFPIFQGFRFDKDDVSYD